MAAVARAPISRPTLAWAPPALGPDEKEVVSNYRGSMTATSCGSSPACNDCFSPSCSCSKVSVVPQVSTLSRFFTSLRNQSSPEARADAVLGDVVDSFCRSLHQSSQKHKPSVQALLEGVTAADRQETLVWLVQAFDVMHFSDSLLFDTALLLDRYYASQPREDARSGGTQRKLLAAVCMALKTGAPIDTQLSLRDLIKHLGRGSVPFDDVIQAELSMLPKLRFEVGTPSSRDFLEALSTRLKNERVSGACWSLAEFLLQLTLVDAQLHYRFPHAVLASAALSLALDASQAPSSAYTALLEDLALHFQDTSTNCPPLLIECCMAVHAHWVRSVAVHEQSAYARHLCAKFSKLAHFAVAAMQPTALAPSSLPPPLAWTPSSPAIGNSGIDSRSTGASAGVASQDDMEEAIALVRQSILIDGSSTDSLRARHHGRCPRCGRNYPGSCSCPDSGFAPELTEEINSLAGRLRGPAEASWKVRSVLSRHGWAAGRFRRAPDREFLLRELQRAASTARPRAGGGRSGSSGGPASGGSASGGITAARAATSSEQHRRRRAASWAGMRSTAAGSTGAATAVANASSGSSGGAMVSNCGSVSRTLCTTTWSAP